jgi:hypothetical protein
VLAVLPLDRDAVAAAALGDVGDGIVERLRRNVGQRPLQVLLGDQQKAVLGGTFTASTNDAKGKSRECSLFSGKS